MGNTHSLLLKYYSQQKSRRSHRYTTIPHHVLAICQSQVTINTYETPNYCE